MVLSFFLSSLLANIRMSNVRAETIIEAPSELVNEQQGTLQTSILTPLSHVINRFYGEMHERRSRMAAQVHSFTKYSTPQNGLPNDAAFGSSVAKPLGGSEEIKSKDCVQQGTKGAISATNTRLRRHNNRMGVAESHQALSVLDLSQSSQGAKESSRSQSATNGETTSPGFPQSHEDLAARDVLGTAQTSISSVVLSASPLSPQALQPPITATSPANNIDIELSSAQIYRFKKNLYVGKVREVRPHLAVIKEWENDILPRLLTDLKPIYDAKAPFQSNEESIIEPQLCMSGFAAKGANYVTLTPCIWIRCGSKRCKEDVKEAVKDLSWVRSFDQGVVEVHIRAPRFTASGSTRLIEGLDFDQGFPRADGTILHLHVEEVPAVISACGLLCVATVTKDGAVIRQRVSRIGGLIRVNGFELYGVTTAHAMLDDCLDDCQRQIASAPDSDDSDFDSDDSTCPYEDDTMGNGLEKPQSGCQQPQLGAMNPDRIKLWRPVRLGGPINFLGKDASELSGWSLSGSLYHLAAVDADFALLDILTPAPKLRNSYRAGSFEPKSVDTFLGDENLQEGPVHILFGHRDIVEGYLLPITSAFLTRGVVFQTRKIQLESLLGTSCS